MLQNLKTEPEKIELVLNLLAEGVDPAALVRVCGHCEDTIHRWLSRAGHHASLFHDDYFHDLQLDYLQLDELFVNIRQEEGCSWLWAVIGPTTKIISSLHIGSRKTTDAMILFTTSPYVWLLTVSRS